MGDSVSDYVIFVTGGGTKGNSGFDFESAYDKAPMAEEAKKAFQAVGSNKHVLQELIGRLYLPLMSLR
eukprot:3640547-Pyramimonas_sp.AAC.1